MIKIKVKVKKKLAKKLNKLKDYRRDNMSMDEAKEASKPITSLVGFE